ncbi:MAG: hypothetical protein KAT66_06150 [Candidatus Lokiarchaeota archaeon]|nr:hypothetical protein [Candidatus Lokiarchaeota archaeon]
MSKNSKVLVISCLVIFSIIYLGYNTTNEQLKTSNGLHLANGDTFTGDYNGDISILYYERNFSFSSWLYQNSSTNIVRHNASFNGYEYKINNLEIWTDNIVNASGAGEFIIADDISNQISLEPAIAYSQEFTVDDLIAIDEILLYLNYSLMVGPVEFYYMFLQIFNEDFTEEIDWMYREEDSWDIQEWVSFYPHPNIFEPGQKYNFLFIIATKEFNPIPNDFWKAEQYKNSTFNKGITRSFDGVNLLPIPNDDTVDMLCKFTYSTLVNPADIDLKYIINDEIIDPIYQPSSWGFMGYEAYYSIALDAPVTTDFNITVVTNQTIESCQVYIEAFYIHLINATGTYYVDENKIEWTIEYPYEILTFGYFFLFERDWDFMGFYNPYGYEVEQIFFGPINLYNHSYYGITTLFGPPLERGTYTGIFHSPNYCHTISTKLKKGGDFIDKITFETGQTIRLDAEIFNSLNEPMTGGSGQIIIRSSSGQILHNETGLTAINGTMSSSEIKLGSGFKKGSYEVTIFWTNGEEIAYFSTTFVIEEPVDILFYVALITGIALAAIPVAFVSRRYIMQRNWQKSLRNLFILTKDGLSLYEYSFGIEIQDPALISGMIAALTNFVREATGSKKALRTVDQEDKKVLLFHGNYTTTALLGEKDLPIIHKRIRKFSESFEDRFGTHLKSWKGETTLFKEAEIIVTKYFPINVEEQVIRGVRAKLAEFRERLETLIEPNKIISLMREITDFLSRYRTIVNKYYTDYYLEIIRAAEDKISPA